MPEKQGRGIRDEGLGEGNSRGSPSASFVPASSLVPHPCHAIKSVSSDGQEEESPWRGRLVSRLDRSAQTDRPGDSSHPPRRGRLVVLQQPEAESPQRRRGSDRRGKAGAEFAGRV